MSEDKLSQNDIDALIAKMRGGGATPAPPKDDNTAICEQLGISKLEFKGLGKLFEISINASSEVLQTITQKEITVDSIGEIKLAGRREISALIEPPFISTKVDYTVGLRGLELFLIKQQDMNDLMKLQFESMGYFPDDDNEEFILSASQEVMNQMLGNTAAKLGAALDILVDISTPDATVITGQDDNKEIEALKEDSTSYVYTTFKLNIGGQITGDLIKVLDADFIEELTGIMNNSTFLDEWRGEFEEEKKDNNATNNEIDGEEIEDEDSFSHSIHVLEDDIPQNQQIPQQIPQYTNSYESYSDLSPSAGYTKPTSIVNGDDTHVTKYVLPQLEQKINPNIQTASTNRIKSVEVELTVELGRTKMKVKDILELDKGSIIELNRLAGEHVDLYANGTLISKGEVVVIKDNFAFRVLNIIDQDYR